MVQLNTMPLPARAEVVGIPRIALVVGPNEEAVGVPARGSAGLESIAQLRQPRAWRPVCWGHAVYELVPRDDVMVLPKLTVCRCDEKTSHVQTDART